jgi:hypothetical protein
MASKRAKSNRGRYFGRRRAKTVRSEVLNDIRALDPRVSRDAAWAYYDEMDLDFSRIKARAA